MDDQSHAEAADLTAGCLALAAPRFELVPLRGMRELAGALPAGATVTVTCSPRHGLERTLEAAEALTADGFRTVPHLAARLVRDRADLQRILDRLAAAGIRECFVVGGDENRPLGSYAGGVELLEAMASMAPRPDVVGVPAYPEGHPRLSEQALQRALDIKAGLADYAVTQMCFEPERVRSWLQRQRERGMWLPVFAGLPGVMERRRLIMIAMKIGLGPSTRALTRQRGLLGRLMQQGVYRPDDLIWQLAPLVGPVGTHGLAGFHINTFNQVADTRGWLEEIHSAYCHWHGVDLAGGGTAPGQVPVEQPSG